MADRTSTQCPDQTTLRRLVDGTLTAEQAAELEDHISCCKSCRRRIDAFAPRGLVAQAQQFLASPEPLAADLIELMKPGRDDVSHVTSSPRTTNGWEDVRQWIDLENDATERSLGHFDGYRLQRFLGRGGMGIVFQAWDSELHRDVAIKILTPSLLAGPSTRERFTREARAIASIRHPAVVAIHRVGQVGPLPYFVMEYVDGKPLDRILDAKGPLTPKRAVSIAYQVACGLAAAHKNGHIHRDIKPANILIESATGRVRIVDFGLARSETDSRLTSTDAVIGTPAYMAPETVLAEPQNERTDLYSLGAVMYHMLAGRPPIEAASAIATIAKIAAGQQDSVAEHVPSDASPALYDIVDRLLSQKASDRYSSAQELGRELKRLAGNDTFERQIDGRLRTSLFTRRIAGGAALAGLLVTGVFLARPTEPPLSVAPPPVDDDPPALQTSSVADLAAGSAIPPPTVNAAPVIPRAMGKPQTIVTAESLDKSPLSPEFAASEPTPPTATNDTQIVCYSENDEVVSEVDSMAEAALLVPDHGRMVLPAGRFEISSPIDFEDRSVTITTAGPQHVELVVTVDFDAPAISSDGDLVLERIDFSSTAEPFDEDAPDRCHVAIFDGTLRCYDCTFNPFGETAVRLDNCDDVAFRRCDFDTPDGIGIEWSADDVNGQLIIEDTNFFVHSSVVFSSFCPRETQLFDCIALSNVVVAYYLEADEVANILRQTRNVRDSTFVGRAAILAMYSEEPLPQRIATRLLAWSGDTNRLSEPILFAEHEGDESETTWEVAHLQDWRQCRAVTEHNATVMSDDVIDQLDSFAEQSPSAKTLRERLRNWRRQDHGN